MGKEAKKDSNKKSSVINTLRTLLHLKPGTLRLSGKYMNNIARLQ